MVVNSFAFRARVGNVFAVGTYDYLAPYEVDEGGEDVADVALREADTGDCGGVAHAERASLCNGRG